MNQKKNCNLYHAFFENVSATSDAVLIETQQGISYTYSEAEKHSARLACYLTSLGFKPGERVTVQVEKSPQAVWLYLACLRAGLVFHPLNTAYQASELKYFLSDAEPVMVVCDSKNVSLISSLAQHNGINHVATLNSDGSGNLMDAAKRCPDKYTTVFRSPEDLAALLYSSGTTGRPKGIMLTHKNLYENAKTLTDTWQFTTSDRLLHALPIFHVHGLFVAIGCVMMNNASMRWLSKFDVAATIHFLPECTVMMGVPTYYTRLMANAEFNRDTCRNTRLFISGSAPLLKETFDEFQNRTGHAILERYGMTETGMNTSNPVDGERRSGTVGFPLPNIELRVVDNKGKALVAGKIGNIQVKGSNVFKGYWKKPDKTAEDFTSDGFFNTGDKGKIDEDGYVSIVGRAKDMVITGGLNVYPAEVEQVLNELDGVVETAVVGIPHPDFGEAVVAVVVRKNKSQLTEQTIINKVKSQLANFKVPKKVFFLNELPRNTMGKIQKNSLRDLYSG